MALIGTVWTPEERLNYIYGMMKVDMKDIELDFYQDAIIRSNYVYTGILKARQIGWSFLVALKGMVMALDPARIKYTKQFISYNFEDATEKIRYCREFYESIPAKYKKKLIHKTSTMMEFADEGGKTTSRLISIACRPPRGKNGDISFDEMAFYPRNRARAIYAAGANAILRGGRIEAGSTPFGASGIFYEIMTDKQAFKTYKRYNVPWWFSSIMCKSVEEAAELAPEMDTETRVRRWGTDKLVGIFESNFLEDFQQEQECHFVDSASSYISLELIHSNTPGMRDGDRDMALADDDDQEKEEIEVYAAKTAQELMDLYDREKHGMLYLGYDVGRRRDAAVIFAIGHINGLKISLANIEMRNTPFDDQMDNFYVIMESLPVMRLCLDMTGMGEPLCESLIKRYGDKIEGVLFSSESKEMLCIAVKRGLEKKEFLLQNDRAFHNQIHSIKREPTQVGRFRYDAERNERGHADSFWAWALANYAITQTTSSSPGFYQQLQAKKEGKPKGAGVKPTGSKRGKSLATVERSWKHGK
jgi:phage FluMu gp28-like protein